ncbi:MAG: hypothetical protein KKE24_03355 [Candidatus Thermoplasmatota archaeon]|nr:hypothetical protein [Candidatus Thermoplasmatota archaeon]
MISVEQGEMDDLAEVDEIINKVLLLYTMNGLSEYGTLDKWKIQKTAFFNQYDAQVKRIKGINYQFFKWTHGPMSAEIVKDLDLFNQIGFVELKGQNKAIEAITKEGKELVSQMSEFIDSGENAPIIDHLSGWIHHLGEYTGRELRDLSHRCQVPYRDSTAKIDDIPDGTPLLNPIKLRDVSYEFEIPKEWIRTLDLMFSYRYPEIRETLETPFKAKELLTWSEVFESE